jgi:hypothetical protein
MHHVNTHIQEEVEDSYTSAFLDIEEASDNTSHYITQAAKWHGLGDTI